MATSEKSMVFWTAVSAIGTVLAAIAAFGIFGPDEPNPRLVDEAQPSASSTPVRDTTDRADIELVYNGDALGGCSLQLTVTIGDQTVLPNSNPYPMRDVETGTQMYSIRGGISCPTAGQCQATGSGNVRVADGETYYLSWLNTSYAACDITLTRQ